MLALISIASEIVPRNFGGCYDGTVSAGGCGGFVGNVSVGCDFGDGVGSGVVVVIVVGRGGGVGGGSGDGSTVNGCLGDNDVVVMVLMAQRVSWKRNRRRVSIFFLFMEFHR